MAERLIAAVLKTAVGDEPTVGSNPSLSALYGIATLKAPVYGAFAFLVCYVSVISSIVSAHYTIYSLYIN